MSYLLSNRSERMVKMNKNDNFLPKEWVELVKDAMKSGVTKESFKNFLEEEKEKKQISPDNLTYNLSQK